MDKSKFTFLYVFVIIFIVSILGFLCIKNQDYYSDELPHTTQIRNFVEKDYTIVPYLTVIPGYHFFVAEFVGFFKIFSIQIVRFISMILLLLLLIPLLYNIIDKDKEIKILQIFFFPILFIFWFLVYTDLFSCFIILLSYYFLTKEKYNISGICAILSVLVRQNNIVWFIFFIGLIFFKFFKIEKLNFKNIFLVFNKQFLWKIKFFVLGIIGFGLFTLVMNGSLVLGDKTSHPIAVHFGNIWFMLFMIPILFFPIVFCRLEKGIKMIFKNSKMLILYVGIILLGLGTFVNNHIYNQNTVFLKNKILVWATYNWINEIFFFIVICISILFLLTYDWKKEQILFFICTGLYLMMSWLIDVRYYVIFFMFFMIWRPVEEKKIFEWYQLIYSIIFAIIMFWGILQWKIFW